MTQEPLSATEQESQAIPAPQAEMEEESLVTQAGTEQKSQATQVIQVTQAALVVLDPYISLDTGEMGALKANQVRPPFTVRQ